MLQDKWNLGSEALECTQYEKLIFIVRLYLTVTFILYKLLN